MPYIALKNILEQYKLEEEYMGSYTNGQMINDLIYSQILYNCCHSSTFNLKLGHNTQRLLVKIKRATVKEIAEHLIRLTKILLASHVTARCEQPQNIIHRLRKVWKRVEVRGHRMDRRMVGKKMILVLM